MRVAVIGAGNGGQAIAGYLAMMGHSVSLYDMSLSKVEELKSLKNTITLVGRIQGSGKLNLITTDIANAIAGASLIMITTIANAHQTVAESMSSYLEDGQMIVLNPGRTCGALVFKQALVKCGCYKRVYVGEAQTLVYACRIIRNGLVNIIGVKDEVLFSALPAADTDIMLRSINSLYSSFKPVPNVLHTSLENIGAMFHPCVCLFNAATIERQDEFWFYRDMTEQVAQFIMRFDAERLAVGKAYNINLINVNEWIKVAYQSTAGETLCERMKANPAYHDIKAPGTIFTRQLTEDIPTGVLPIAELGKAAGIETPLLSSMITIIEALLDIDFHSNGRSLEFLGLQNMSSSDILRYVTNGK